jgi:hypothetical protein
MTIRSRKKIVLLGMMSKMPQGGNIWLVLQYLIGFQRLGFDVYYVEAHGRTPREVMRGPDDDPWARAAEFIDGIMRRFDLGDCWAYDPVHKANSCYGMSAAQLRALYHQAALIINLHGGTTPLAEHSAAGRLVYLGTDPVEVELALHENVQKTIDFLEPHCAFFTWGLNYGKPDCKLPYSERFRFQPSPPPVIVEFWQPHANGPGDVFTTIGNWRQPFRNVRFQDEVYSWSKHHEFLKFIDVPARTGQQFQLALSSYGDEDRQLLESKGWQVRNALEFSTDPDQYRHYITHSRGEFTVAKDQNVRLRTGWFSERSAQYLAAGRPVITQETGFSNVLPGGAGLFGFSTMEEIVAAVQSINGDLARHSRAARTLARDYFNYDVVLKKMLAEVGL